MPAYEIPGKRVSLKAGADLSAKRYCGVAVNASGEAILPAVAGDQIVGVTQLPAILGEVQPVMTDGISFILLGGVVAANDSLEAKADGSFVKQTTGKLAGIALVGGAAGEIGTMLIK